MITQFELFKKVSVGRISRSMRVSLNKRGIFSLNQKAFDDLKQPEAVELYFDKVNNLIGIQPCAPDAEYAYAVKQQGKHKSWLIRALAFLTFYKISVTGTILFTDPKLNENNGMVILPLDTATAIKKKSKPDQEDQTGVLRFGSTG